MTRAKIKPEPFMTYSAKFEEYKGITVDRLEDLCWQSFQRSLWGGKIITPCNDRLTEYSGSWDEIINLLEEFGY